MLYGVLCFLYSNKKDVEIAKHDRRRKVCVKLQIIFMKDTTYQHKKVTEHFQNKKSFRTSQIFNIYVQALPPRENFHAVK